MIAWTNPRSTVTFASAVIVFFLLLFAAFGSWFQVDQGERVVVLRNGAFIKVAEPGLGFKLPFFDSTAHISVRDHTFGLDLEAYSYDQQPANLHATVIYRVPPAMVRQLYEEFGSIELMQNRLLERKVMEEIKNVFGGFTAVRAIQQRQQLSADANASFREAVKNAPVQIVGLQIEEVEFSEVYEKSIEQRMLAQVQIETTRQQKDTAVINAEIQVVRATADADARRQAYMAEADGIKLRGDAEAAAIQARAKALAENVNLVQLQAVERWNGVLPQTLLPGSALPFIGVK